MRQKYSWSRRKNINILGFFIDLNKVLNPLNGSNKCSDLHRSQVHQEFLQPHVVLPKKDFTFFKRTITSYGVLAGPLGMERYREKKWCLNLHWGQVRSYMWSVTWVWSQIVCLLELSSCETIQETSVLLEKCTWLWSRLVCLLMFSSREFFQET
jgi:hypothetical protein